MQPCMLLKTQGRYLLTKSRFQFSIATTAMKSQPTFYWGMVLLYSGIVVLGSGLAIAQSKKAGLRLDLSDRAITSILIECRISGNATCGDYDSALRKLGFTRDPVAITGRMPTDVTTPDQITYGLSYSRRSRQ
jgi:hypothetical protein